MIRRTFVFLATCVSVLALAGGALAVTESYEYVGASSGNYAQTGGEYTQGYRWSRYMGGPTYSWYVFTLGGTLQASGIGVTYPSASWYAGWNNRIWKFYNGSAGVQGFDVFARVP